MTSWQELLEKEGRLPEWPYPISYDKEQTIDTDVLVLGGGIAGCWAAISAARKGVRVALVEKGATIRSGQGGPGCDHWCDTPANPLSKVDPDEWAQRLVDNQGGYACGIGRQIQCRENYDTLLELEKMGGKIRDAENQYAGAEGRDEKTRLMFSPRMNPNHQTNVVLRVWGTTFKPVLKRECQRLGVKIYDRVMATSLLNERGIQGARVIGATGVNTRTGEFMVFTSKATVLCTAGPMAVWFFLTELAGFNSSNKPRNITGDGIAMAWKAGAELTLMESSQPLTNGTAYKHKLYTGAGDPSYENVPIVDADGKRIPVPIQGWSDGAMPGAPRAHWDTIRERVLKGEYALPFYGDFPAMPEIERAATWNLMLGEESTTRNITRSYEQAGFDPGKDLLMGYQLIEGGILAQWRSVDAGRNRGGLLVDWDLKSTLDGLYAAGQQTFSPGDHSYAAATGRYAGRKAADYARRIDRATASVNQVAIEKARIYAPVKKNHGLEWKELHAGIAGAMQYFCSEYKTGLLFNMGLDSLRNIEENWVPELYAPDPHKLLRTLEDLSILTVARIIIETSLARQASSRFLDFHRIDYPELDPSEWNKFLTVKLENGRVKVGSLPLGYWGNLVKDYENHNKDYKGINEE
jgi:succinate dehydrogenase/fumarate reductase flavoprotein subunit